VMANYALAENDNWQLYLVNMMTKETGDKPEEG